MLCPSVELSCRMSRKISEILNMFELLSKFCVRWSVHRQLNGVRNELTEAQQTDRAGEPKLVTLIVHAFCYHRSSQLPNPPSVTSTLCVNSFTT
jgi:hypothetical protein